jgi:hypothetical protein
MIPKIILIFLAGVIIELLSARYTRNVAERKIWSPTLLSGLITITNFALLMFIIKENAFGGFFSILVYAGGNALGTYIALKTFNFDISKNLRI